MSIVLRILVEPSDYTLFNIGDTAMLQIAVNRLRILFPDAAIQVFSNDPEALKFYCPDAIPLCPPTRSAGRYTLAPVYQFLEQDRLTKSMCSFVRIFRHRVSPLARAVMQHLLKKSGHLSEELQLYLRAIAEADLVVVSGMGGITDAFLMYAHGLLDTLGLAIYLGVPTAMLGQGMGPLENPQLISRATEIFPYVRLFSLREGRVGPPLLKSVGVSPERILVTGDDAIEAAYRLRVEQPGNGLGLNLRVADYSLVGQSLIESIRPAVQDFASLNHAPLVPVPISRVSGEEDLVSIRHLVAGYQNVLGLDEEFNTQEKVIRQILHCRVVITGSYHAAVFALAMGIPAVCLAKSAYYVDKFLGLAGLFPMGCQVVLLDEPQVTARLIDAVENMWEAAEQVRPGLLKAAEDQIRWSHAAYQRLSQFVSYKYGAQRSQLELPILSN